MKRKWIWAVLALLLLLYFVPVKRTVEKTFSCTVLDQMDEGFHGNTEVTFSGEYTDYILRRDSFKGRIDCIDYDLMDEDSTHTEVNAGVLDEIRNYNPNGSWLDIKYTASIHMEENLERFFIWVYVPVDDKSGVSHGRYFLCYPDMTLQEIYNIIDEQYS